MHFTIAAPFLQQAAAVHHIIFILVQLVLHQLHIRLFRKVNRYPFILFVADLEYPSQGFVVHIRVGAMALVFVVPIVHNYRPAGRNTEINPLRPEIVRIDKVFTVARCIARPGALGNIHVHPEAVNVVHENGIPVYPPMAITEVEHRAGMGMPPSGSGRPEVAGVRTLVAEPMYVVGDSLDIVIRIGIEMLPTLPMVSCALDDVEQVRDDTYRGKRMPVIVEGEAPGVACPVRENLKLMARGVVTPHPSIDGGPFIVRRAGFSYIGMRKYAMG